ncbi:uncharacterized protein LOC116845910 [Odontomachus brunneus]|uniref:uncharacterized protein LOC116845910 n=1 Tax=Odontomachus brunneus TaxID=486640 RepID=UPI0013F209FE|nr:uncharacterized protein LOC116845910 [Odontomachus brunneus]
MEHIYYDWKSFKSKVELDILDDYACTAKLLTKIFTFSTFIMISDIILVHIMPLFLDVILPLNESRSLHLYIKVEYFVNQSKYMPFLVVHIYRMKVTMDKDVLRIPNPEQERIILKRLVCTIDLHRRNLLFCNILMNRLERVYFVLIIPSVASLSICMFRFMQAIMARDSIMEISISFGLFLIQILFIFFGNHCGQQITNNNAEIFDTV